MKSSYEILNEELMMLNRRLPNSPPRPQITLQYSGPFPEDKRMIWELALRVGSDVVYLTKTSFSRSADEDSIREIMYDSMAGDIIRAGIARVCPHDEISCAILRKE